MYQGRSSHTIDPKGRLIVPVKLRRELGGLFYITVGMDKCLDIYPKEEWDALSAKARELPTTEPAVRKFIRKIFGNAVECEPDGQWRVAIPANLREYAGIEKELFIIGVNSKLEIWSKGSWEQMQEDEGDELDPDLMKKITAFIVDQKRED